MHKDQLNFIAVVERRRKRPAEAKARIMEEALAPGATIAGRCGPAWRFPQPGLWVVPGSAGGQTAGDIYGFRRLRCFLTG